MKLIFDTETTGLAKFTGGIEESRIVQIGMIVVDGKYNIMHEVGLIIKPDGFTIPKHVSDIHGITNEIANKYGVGIKGALLLFTQFSAQCDEIIGHNIKFDMAMIVSELMKCALARPILPTFCTMLTTTDICCIESKRGGYKWPKLVEVYKFFFNEELVDAHDALTDVRACLRVYKKLMSMKKEYEVAEAMS